MNREEEKRVEDFKRKVGYEEPVTRKDLEKALETAMAASDFGILEPFSDKVELSFPKTLSDHDVCIMCVKKKGDS